MTSTPAPNTAEYELEEFYASRRPIRRFIMGLVATSAALLLVWWAGVFAPRLSAEVSSGEFDLSNGNGSMYLDLVNDAPTPVRIHGVEIPMNSFTVTATTLDGEALTADPEVGGGSAAVLQLDYRIDGCLRTSPQTAVPLRVQVKTIGGTTRTVFVYAPFPTTAAPVPVC